MKNNLKNLLKNALAGLALGGLVALVLWPEPKVAEGAIAYVYYTQVVGAGWQSNVVGNALVPAIYGNSTGFSPGVTNIFTNPVSVSVSMLWSNLPLYTTSIYSYGSTVLTNIYTNTLTVSTNATTEVPYYPAGNGNTYGTANGHLSFFGQYPPIQQPAMFTNPVTANALPISTNGDAPTWNAMIQQLNAIASNLNNLGLMK